MKNVILQLLLYSIFQWGMCVQAQPKISNEQVKETMLKATEFMVENASINGGYVWVYMPDFSRRWGEMEAYETMIWLQHPGSVSMGHLFLDAYHATKNEYYYESAQKVAIAIMLGQSKEGGWNYMVDFAGEASLQRWYNTIGKNGWRLEEFQHYYGNSTFDDDVTSDASRFLLRMYLEKKDPEFKNSLNTAIDFILKSQYPNGGWPQRYSLRFDFGKQGFPDYSSFYTFNDGVVWENIHFLIQAYLALGEDRFLDPINRGMNFYRISQDKSGAWGQQLNMKMEAASARTYEPAAFLPSTTCGNAFLLLKFYQLTGDRKFLDGISKSIAWLEETKLPEDKIEGPRTHPTFVDVKTMKPIYVHRKGSNVVNGKYYVDTVDQQLLSHYYGKVRIPLQELKNEFARVSSLTEEEATKDSPLKQKQISTGTNKEYYNLNRYDFISPVDDSKVAEIIGALDNQNRWLTKRVFISNPYIGDGKYSEPTDEYATTQVGDETDTSPYLNTSDQEYISTGEYIRNMKLLLNSIKPVNNN